MRPAPVLANCQADWMDPKMRAKLANVSANTKNSRRSPAVMWPATPSRAPSHVSRPITTPGTAARSMSYRETRRIRVMPAAYAEAAVVSRFASSWSSRPKALTTRAPRTASSMRVVTRARRSSVTHDMPHSRRRMRTTMARLAGSTSTATMASHQLMVSMRMKMASRMRLTTATVGTTSTTSSSSSRSVMARVTIWPVDSESRRSGSVDCSRS